MEKYTKKKMGSRDMIVGKLIAFLKDTITFSWVLFMKRMFLKFQIAINFETTIFVEAKDHQCVCVCTPQSQSLHKPLPLVVEWPGAIY